MVLRHDVAVGALPGKVVHIGLVEVAVAVGVPLVIEVVVGLHRGLGDAVLEDVARGQGGAALLTKSVQRNPIPHDPDLGALGRIVRVQVVSRILKQKLNRALIRIMLFVQTYGMIMVRLVLVAVAEMGVERRPFVVPGEVAKMRRPVIIDDSSGGDDPHRAQGLVDHAGVVGGGVVVVGVGHLHVLPSFA